MKTKIYIIDNKDGRIIEEQQLDERRHKELENLFWKKDGSALEDVITNNIRDITVLFGYEH